MEFVRETWSFKVLWRLLWLVYVPFGVVLLRQRVRWEAPFPRKGSVLLLANHVSFWDPMAVAWPLRRGVRYMASANLFRLPGVAWLVRSLGAFPKERFVKDKDSVLTLVRCYEDGQVVSLFPEGLRTWDGRTAFVGPGIGRLIKRLDARVVYCRNLTGHLSQPRWADYPRWVPIEMEYSAPVQYPQEMTAEEITADVVERIRIVHEPEHVRGPLLGWRLAHGLPSIVWFCPACEELEGLEVDPHNGSRVVCQHCGGAWVLNVLSRLKGEGDAPDTSVAQASDVAKVAVGSPPARDRERLESEGIALSVEEGWVGRIHGKGDVRELAQGPLRVTLAGLEITGETPWVLPYDQMKVCFVDVGNQLQVRTLDALLLLKPGEQSGLMWEHFIESWRKLES